MSPKIILNRLKWDKKFDISKSEIWYIHRGAPNNTRVILGDEVVSLEKSFIQTEKAMIPYHRVFRIIYDNEIIFDMGDDMS